MKNIVITIDTETHEAVTNTSELGIAGEKLQSQFIVDFVKNNLIDGTATVEYKKPSGELGVIDLTKDGNTYTANVPEELTQENEEIKLQVKIVGATTEAGTPIFKSKVFVLKVLESINASGVLK